MELRQLQYFAAVARHGHFTRAAEELYVTQPALSQQVRRLEAELGLALLRRTSRGVELTPAGEDLLVHAEAVLAEVARAREQMDRHAGVSRGIARVAATAADASRLADTLARLHADHPRVQIALRQGSAAEVANLVQRGAVDVAILAGDAQAGVEAHVLTDEPLRVAVALDDGLAGRTVGLADLNGRAFILAEPGTALRDAVMAATQVAGFSPLPLFEVGDPGTVRHLVRAGLGISLVPASWLERPGPVVAAADLDRPPRHRLSLLTPAAGPSPAGRLLFERLRQDLGEL
jgi:DNA-binding transcriptional LysR family regulator